MTRMRFLLSFAAVMGAFVGASPVLQGAEAGGDQQCYYRAGVDPVNSCNTCSASCLGDGYKCCDIVVAD